jgi:hypothetical protein
MTINHIDSVVPPWRKTLSLGEEKRQDPNLRGKFRRGSGKVLHQKEFYSGSQSLRQLFRGLQIL